ncbi:uncharacterized protein LOC117639631 [Thrips palmi]|uniref:Uncharacterized protein LOC117639631 n=1 Tax=Thrips palmi TaxID=161013 RepID=A0A6P8Y4L8_THRPL|nr:uncharacterized protein LOC117639631 [Thrips palmi]
MNAAGGPAETLEGRTSNSLIIHCGDGFYYNRREVRRSRARLQCRHFKKGCPGTASLSLETGWLHHLQPHNHAPDRLFTDDSALRRAMLHEAKTNVHGIKVQSILNDFKVRCPDVQLASRFTTVRMKSQLYRARSSNYPRIPSSLIYLGILLGLPDMRPLCKTVDGADYIFQGVVGSAGDKTIALIFASGRMLQFLQSRDNLHSDGTFRKRSKKPAMAQIFNIVTKYGENIIAIARVLMLTRTTQAYIAVIEQIRTLAPNMNPVRIHCDFERAEMNAWRAMFPRSRVVGCLWHYAVACSCFAHSLGMRDLALENELVFDLIRCLCGVPMLPSHMIWLGVLEIWDEVQQTPWSNNFRPLFEYFEKEWKPRVDELSVFNAPERTNNSSESDNHMLAKVLPQNRPNCFHLIGGFVKLEHLSWCDKVAVDAGRQVTGLRKWKTVHNEAVVQRATNLLVTNQITLAHFLHMSSYAIHAAVMQGLKVRRPINDSESEQSESDNSDSE